MVTTKLTALPRVENIILLMRGERVILDADLADLYGVSTGVLNQAVKRNKKRFPEDFLFQLTENEKTEVITICDNLNKLKYYRGLPYAFTEHGAVMAASVLNSNRAIEISVFVVRAFVKLRETLTSHKQIAHKLSLLENKVAKHDTQIISLLNAIRQLMNPPHSEKKKIGFCR